MITILVQNKKTNKDNQEAGKAGRHIKKGLSAFQKTLTLIGSVLGIITGYHYYECNEVQ